MSQADRAREASIALSAVVYAGQPKAVGGDIAIMVCRERDGSVRLSRLAATTIAAELEARRRPRVPFWVLGLAFTVLGLFGALGHYAAR